MYNEDFLYTDFGHQMHTKEMIKMVLRRDNKEHLSVFVRLYTEDDCVMGFYNFYTKMFHSQIHHFGPIDNEKIIGWSYHDVAFGLLPRPLQLKILSVAPNLANMHTFSLIKKEEENEINK